MREHQIRVLAEPAERTTIGQLTEEESEIYNTLNAKLNRYSQYLEWEGLDSAG